MRRIGHAASPTPPPCAWLPIRAAPGRRAASRRDIADRARPPARFSTSARICGPRRSRGSTATPRTSSSRKADGRPLAFDQRRGRGDAEFGEVDVDQRRRTAPGRRRGRSGAASSEEPMRLAARSISSAPVTTRRTLRTLRHFSASASSRQAAGTSGNSSRCTEVAAGSRASQASSAVKQSIGASQVTVQRNSWSSTVRQALRVTEESDRNRARPCGCRNRTPRDRPS